MKAFLSGIAYGISSIIRQFFLLKQSPKYLDLSYETDLDLWECLGRIKLVLQLKCNRTDLSICSHSSEGLVGWLFWV